MNDIFNEAFKKALRIISISPQFEKSLFLKLRKYGYDDETIKKVILKLEDLNYLNDYEYCKSYVKNLFNKKGYSESFVFNKIIEKGIDREKAKEIIEEIKKEIDEDEVLLKFIKKNKTKFKKYLENNKEREIINTFYRYGFKIEDYDKLLEIIKKIVSI